MENERNRTMKFKDGLFSFFTADYGSWAHDIRIVFRVREDRDPHERAAEKDIKNYDRLRPSLPEEIQSWIGSHPNFPILSKRS